MEPILGSAGRCTLAVDLTQLLPGGENGGLKIAILRFISELRSRYFGRFRFVFLASRFNRREIMRLQEGDDLLVCIARATDEKTFGCLSQGQMNRILKKTGTDVFYCPFGNTQHAISGIPVVAWVTDLLHRDYPQSLSPDEIDWRENYLRVLVRAADFIQVNSEFTARRLHEVYKIPRRKLFVTYLSPQFSFVSRSASIEQKYFLYPANYWIHKNHETLLVGFCHYLKLAGASAWDLYLTGSPGKRMDHIKRLTRLLNIQDKTQFLGYLDSSDFARIYSKASALVFPSLYEGFGLPLVEAMKLGVPIIAGKYGSISEVCGEACEYVNSRNPAAIAEALYKLTTDASYCQQLSSAGLNRLTQLSTERSVDILAEKLLASARLKSDFGSRTKHLSVASYRSWLSMNAGIRSRARYLKQSLIER
jgi:glycosyltransferase involved in cell wall biosynthesis